MENKNSFIGTFTTSEKTVLEKLSQAKAYIFDWDGVFNNSFKQGQFGSGFSEVDSMGTNLLRFSHFLKNKELPLTAIISGEKNESAQFFANREHFDFAFYKIANKIDALNFICKQKNIKPNEVVYFFDDVLDLSIAKVCGVRILINKPAIQLFTNYCIKNNLADYLTACDGGNHGIREASEMLMQIRGNFDDVLKIRTDFGPEYKSYLTKRNEVNTEYFTKDETGAITEG
ncbi:MAG: phosphatase [Bacteroidia bacterium]|nr:phosphatase [Bacteroidia bacterium]